MWNACGVRLVKIPTAQPKSDILDDIDEMLVKRIINSGKYFSLAMAIAKKQHALKQGRRLLAESLLSRAEHF